MGKLDLQSRLSGRWISSKGWAHVSSPTRSGKNGRLESWLYMMPILIFDLQARPAESLGPHDSSMNRRISNVMGLISSENSTWRVSFFGSFGHMYHDNSWCLEILPLIAWDHMLQRFYAVLNLWVGQMSTQRVIDLQSRLPKNEKTPSSFHSRRLPLRKNAVKKWQKKCRRRKCCDNYKFFSGHVGPAAGSLLSASVKPEWHCQGSRAFWLLLQTC